jgi:cysteinyl-tRNA synthetase
MSLRFFNTMTRKLEEFRPIEPGVVRMYTCGPTVYAPAHVGNYRAYTFEDILRRYLIYRGFRVTQVMNLTDIDDKTIRDSNAAGITLQEHTKKYKDMFFRDIDRLNIQRAEHYTAATEHIDIMAELVQKLLDRGHASRSGESDEYEKETASDVALWKGWTESDGAVYWDTPLGKGRPGWHIECSAMSMKYLGEHFDIHTGGVDNIFPHHENEIAQSEGATGKKFVNYWLHNAHLILEGQKMAKSEGNYYTVQDLVEKGHNPLAIRYVLLATHYRQQLNFTMDGLEAAKAAITRLRDFKSNVETANESEGNPDVKSAIDRAVEGFEAGLDDDLNISPSLGAVFDFVRDINAVVAEKGLSSTDKDNVLANLRRFDMVLGVVFTAEEGVDQEIEDLIRQRTGAKEKRDFATADKIRSDLLERGIILEDTPSGTKWKRKI